MVVRHLHLIVGDKGKMVVEEAQQQVGFPRPRRPQKQYAVPVPGGAAGVDVHKNRLVARFCIKGKHLVILESY